MSVGNAILDSDNKALFELVKNIDSAIKANDDFALSLGLHQISACMDQHFLNEELFACELNIQFALHKAAHQNIQAEIHLVRCDLEECGITTIACLNGSGFSQFLRNWLIKHIAEEDMLMKPALQAHPYDFRIDGIEASTEQTLHGQGVL